MNELWAVALISGGTSFTVVFALVGGPSLMRMRAERRAYKARMKRLASLDEEARYWGAES